MTCAGFGSIWPSVREKGAPFGRKSRQATIELHAYGVPISKGAQSDLSAALSRISRHYGKPRRQRRHKQTIFVYPFGACSIKLRHNLAILERIRIEIVSNFNADAALALRKKRGFSVCSVAGSRSRDYPSNPHFQCGIALSIAWPHWRRPHRIHTTCQTNYELLQFGGTPFARGILFRSHVIGYGKRTFRRAVIVCGQERLFLRQRFRRDG